MERYILQEMADNELMELAGQDDREAFEVLVLRYYREAIRAADRMVHDEMQAQDIVQDCFADLYVQRRRYQPSSSFRTYLYTLVKHKSIDCLRKSGRREILLEEEAESLLSEQQSREGSPEEAYLWGECIRKVTEQIGMLPEVQRKALYLYAVEDKSYRIEKGRRFRWAVAVCVGWVTVNLIALYHFGGVYGELLGRIPVYLFLGAGAAGMLFYFRQLLFMTTLTFRKEYSDASN